MKAWTAQTTPEGDGVWFVCAEACVARVLCPPNARLTRKDRDARVEGEPLPWRMATWYQLEFTRLDVDEQPPDRVELLTTVKVLELLPTALHEHVWTVMTHQLRLSRLADRTVPGQGVADEPACVGARTARWLEQELILGFPEREAQLPVPITPGLVDVALPEEFEQALGAVFGAAAEVPRVRFRRRATDWAPARRSSEAELDLPIEARSMRILGTEPVAPIGEPDWADESEQEAVYNH